MQRLITEHLDVWTTAEQPAKAGGRGRAANGNGNKSPYGIQKLRELILELAVRGKLVPQDSNDEPASELLKKIAAEKARLIKEGKIKKQKPLPDISEEEVLISLPKGWMCTRMGNVCEIIRGITFPASEKSKEPEHGRLACLRTSNVQDEIEWDDLLFIREQFVKRDDQIIRASDIVMSMANSRDLVGKVALVRETPRVKTTFGGFLGVIRANQVSPDFLMILLRSPVIKAQLIEGASQTTNIANISLGKLNPLVLFVPPLAEQHRIVAKVDELMALCDRLEREQAESGEAHQTLVETLLCTLTQAKNNQELAEAWRRIAGHFDILFTTEQSIDQLKQTILQLAVMGKLVPQDPNDEPASELLKKIAAEKARLIKEGKIKKQKPLPPISEDEMPFELPEGWEWTRLHNLVEYIQRGKSPKYSENGMVRVVSQKCVQWSGFDISPSRFVDDQTLDKYQPERFLREGDLLWNSTGTGTVGRVAIMPKMGSLMAVADSHVTVIRPFWTDQKFLWIYIASPTIQDRIDPFHEKSLVSGTTKQVELATGAATALPVPVPPLTEQRRIVAKVDELMALCDALKARLGEARAARVHLADAIVEQAVSRA